MRRAFELGVNFFELINACRIQDAEELLALGAEPVEVVGQGDDLADPDVVRLLPGVLRRLVKDIPQRHHVQGLGGSGKRWLFGGRIGAHGLKNSRLTGSEATRQGICPSATSRLMW